MKELERFSEWRYTPIIPKEKRPLLDEWQLNPIPFSDLPNVPSECNVGLLLGPVSGGVVALDFDGEEAWEYWAKHFDFEPPKTVCWTSGKELRMQMLYSVPPAYWDALKKKVVSKLEFRWTGGQSVLPPSELADGRTYTWINSPSTTEICPLPQAVLEHWLTLILNSDIPKEPMTTDGLNHFVLQKLHAIGCIHRKGSATVNLWHRGEQTKGGWFVYIDNPLWVNHNGQKSIKVGQWIKQYWFLETQIERDYRDMLVAELKEIRAKDTK